MDAGLRIGGAPPITLRARDLPANGPAFVEAVVLPGRGMMLLQAHLRLPSGQVVDAIVAPSGHAASEAMNGDADDFAGNRSFSFGGAVLAPYANRIRGLPLPDRREIETVVAGRIVRLPANWGGKAPDAKPYAMHGLILDRAFAAEQATPDRAEGRLAAGDFGGRWPGTSDITIAWSLRGGALALHVEVANSGSEPTPVGLGWHPYFALPSGDRRQVRLHLAARSRTLVNAYDEVLPTGALEAVAGGAYDFHAAEGRALGEQYLDDCFTDLAAGPGGCLAELRDPAAGIGLRIPSPSPAISAFLVYAPPERALVVIEPQFNLADPYGSEWRGRDTGMATIPAGGRVTYDVVVEAFAVGNP